MREIKFRAWMPKFGVMSYSYTLAEILNDSLDHSDSDIWLEYTGLKDHLGTQIYEGDLVFADSNEYTYEIKFGTYPNEHDKEYECTGWYAELVGGDYKCSLQMTESLEVIGNIYSNADLLGRRDENEARNAK